MAGGKIGTKLLHSFCNNKVYICSMASVLPLGRFKKEENMKRVVLMLVILLCLVSTPLSARVNEDIGKTLEAMQKEKNAIIAAEMKLTEQEKNGFWPLYREYQEALRKVQGRSFKLISEYAQEKEKDTFSDEKAKVLLKEYLDLVWCPLNR